MKANFKQNVLCAVLWYTVLMLALALVLMCSGVAAYEDAADRGTFSDISFQRARLVNEVTKTYGNGKKNFTVGEPSAEKYVDSVNLDQSELNKTYNVKYKKNISGTCSEVAVTIAEHVLANASTHIGVMQNTFDYLVNYATRTGYLTDNGTEHGTQDRIMQEAFSRYSATYRKYNAKTNYWSVYNTIKNNADNDMLSLLSVKNHTMVAAGYIEFPVSWQEDTYFLWWKTGTKTVHDTAAYVIVNSGSVTCTTLNERNMDSIYSFFPAKKILETFFTSLMQNSSFYNVVIQKI